MTDQLKLRNNFIMSAVKTGYGDVEGNITHRHLAFWERRSKHVGAVIFEPFYLDKHVRELPTQIGIDTDDKIPGHKKLVETVRKNGAKAIAHLNHPGRMANPNIPGNYLLSASEIPCPNGGKTPRSLTIQEIHGVQRLFTEAAIRSEKAGYDAIELQFGLGYLIAQFISPVSNLRTDHYGGSLENRMRFGLEILRAIKSSISLPVIIRVSGDEKYAGGLGPDQVAEIVKMLENEDVAALHITSGDVCMSPPWYYQHHFIPKGATWQIAKSIKAETRLPIIAVGQITEKEDIETIIGNKYSDYIAIGRALIADPDFVGKCIGADVGNIRPCSSCLTGCLGRIKVGKGLQCEINPEVGRETEQFFPAAASKKFAVIGGGMAGMQAAITLKQRGHTVEIFEKSELGGQFLLAPLPSNKGSLQKQIEYFKTEISDIPVIKKKAEADDLLGKYDEIVIATGSKPFIPEIAGLNNYSWAEILYQKNIPTGRKVLIIGGGLIGVEVANTLSDNNNEVIIIEMMDEIARDMEMVSRKLNLGQLQRKRIPVHTKCTVENFTGGSAKIRNLTDNSVFEINSIDLVVIAAGMRSDRQLFEKINTKIPVHIVGDAEKPGDVVSAIQSAFFTCREL
ncbi:MAG: NAD(P)/FAD-dependent oxidoreductase [Ignavibacteriales bacterium]|nr:NAD(P)/FAD-dependent oxidoreductase [Ignavibacteriales bacterium]MCF8316350.1 NAD(P)/FAD-dependent oxidoreductase [Ignavibacteriales bacterium]MCF8437692.1 NAD(P)/FAD-dependent oxidoreductase [Ignavibacteriales bacterium]